MNDNTRQLLDFQDEQTRLLKRINWAMRSVNATCLLVCIWLILKGLSTILQIWNYLLTVGQY